MFRVRDLRPGVDRLNVSLTGAAAMQTGDLEVRAGLEANIEIALPSLGACPSITARRT